MLVAILGLALGIPAVSSSGASTEQVAKGTITVSLGVNAVGPIFPFPSCVASLSDTTQFQDLMYRPLYWFGLGSSTAVQYPLSPADKPVAADGDTQMTINLKGWTFSDGQAVDAQSVALFLNLLDANPQKYCGYSAGYGIPDQVASVTYPSGLGGDTVVLRFTTKVDPAWILGNYLSEIVPMPEAWDIASAGAATGSGGCSTDAFGSPAATTDCEAVLRFLTSQSSDASTYAGPMWQTVDGPWRLASLGAGGVATLVPNGSYSGPQKPELAKVIERPEALGSVYASLKAGTTQIGYLDPTSLTSDARGPGEAGKNIAALNSKFALETSLSWGFAYDDWDFSASGPQGAEIHQLYIRQALQGSLNQARAIKQIFHGYATPTCSPLPFDAPSTIAGKVPCDYPYNPTKERSVLASHGWKLEKGLRTCTRPGTGPSKCGAGIAYGDTLAFVMTNPWQYVGRVTELHELILQRYLWDAIGVHFSWFSPSLSSDCGGTSGLCSTAWVYEPDFYPSGEALFTPTGWYNPGHYSDPTMTQLIRESTAGPQNLTAFARYAATQVPVLYVPTPLPLEEVSRSLKCAVPGACALNPQGDFMPEYYSY